MKTGFVKTVGLFLAMAAINSGCKKYEDGPLISIIPKNERVANTWVIDRAMADNQDVTADYNQYQLYLTRDGDAELTASYKVFGVTYTTDTDGTWEFTNNKDNIKFDYEDDGQDKEYQILKLTEKEFLLREVGAELELHLREK